MLHIPVEGAAVGRLEGILVGAFESAVEGASVGGTWEETRDRRRLKQGITVIWYIPWSSFFFKAISGSSTVP